MILTLSSYFYNPYSLPMFLAGLFILSLGLIALLRNRSELSSSAFFILSLALSVWLTGVGIVYSSRTAEVAEFWNRFFWCGVVWIGSLFYFFVQTLIGKAKLRRCSILLNFAGSLFFMGLVLFSDSLIHGANHYFWGFYAKAGWMIFPFLAVFFYQMVSALSHCLQEMKTEESEIKRKQIKAVFVAFALGLVGSVDYLPALGVSIYPFGYIPVIILWSVMFYAIVRYKLWDVYVRPDLLGAFKKEQQELCYRKGKNTFLLGFLFNNFFILTDHFFGQERFWQFFKLRAIFSIQIALSFLFVVFFKKLGKRWINEFFVLVCIGIDIVLMQMCLLSGGFNSLYYFGFVFVPLFLCILLPWHPGYQILASVLNQIIYASQWFFVGPNNAPLWIALTYNWFILSIGLVTSIASYTSYRMRFQLKEKEQAKNDFFANISHELKTPVALIVAPLESATKQATHNESISLPKESFEAICHNAYRLSALIGDLLDLTRSEVGKTRVVPEAVEDPKGYFENIFKSVVPLMREKGIEGEFREGE